MFFVCIFLVDFFLLGLKKEDVDVGNINFVVFFGLSGWNVNVFDKYVKVLMLFGVVNWKFLGVRDGGFKFGFGFFVFLFIFFELFLLNEIVFFMFFRVGKLIFVNFWVVFLSGICWVFLIFFVDFFWSFLVWDFVFIWFFGFFVLEMK